MENESTIADDSTDITAAAQPTADEQVADEQLIEEISIDGMCGVY
ncbi:MAG: mycofactocin precursor [Acidimicrobiaceae bacterium]|nr:mycofactocin precursor [Acidimicrobiaceae bacterium]